MTPIFVLYGTETYNSEGLAQRTGDLLEAEGWAVEVIDMGDLEPEELSAMNIMLIITSTFGDGDPPSNAEEVHDYLMSANAPNLSSVHFSVCALGDTDYEHFCQCGKDFDQRLEELGASRLAQRVDCDRDFEDPWQSWIDSVLVGLQNVAAAPLAASQAPASMSIRIDESEEADIDELDSIPPPSVIFEPQDGPSQRRSSKKRSAIGTRKNPFFGFVLANENMNDTVSQKETRHIAISIEGSGINYSVGDTLGIFPRNCPDLVRRILKAVEVPRESPVHFDGEWFTIRDILIYRKDVVTIDRRLLTTLASLDDKGPIAALVRDKATAQEYMANHHVLDCLELADVSIEPQDFLACLRPLPPRLYSIASSPTLHPDEIHITVDVLRYDLHGTSRKGVCSTFLSERAGTGVEVAIYLQPTKHFHLCEDDMPIIMVGPGTGIAPFRAFLQERYGREADGQSWLFFGSQREALDFLYRDELLDWVDDGTIARLDLAWSRDQDHKVYVQDKLYESGPNIWRWLEAGAFVYICGDASRMAKDVHKMLIRIVEEFGNLSQADAEAYIQRMSDEKRYLKDVY